MRGPIETVVVDPNGIPQKMDTITPPRIFVNVDGVIPKGYPIGTTAFVVEKLASIWCDGRNNWFMEPDKPVAAGQSWSAFFS